VIDQFLLGNRPAAPMGQRSEPHAESGRGHQSSLRPRGRPDPERHGRRLCLAVLGAGPLASGTEPTRGNSC
jgi:hypothetical protein